MGFATLEIGHNSPIWQYADTRDPYSSIDILKDVYIAFAYDPDGADRFHVTIGDLEQSLRVAPLNNKSLRGLIDRYRENLSMFLPPHGSPRRMLIDALAQNYSYISEEIGTIIREAKNDPVLFRGNIGILRGAQVNAAGIQALLEKTLHDSDVESDLSFMAQGWSGKLDIKSAMIWAGFLNLLNVNNNGQDDLIPSHVSRLIRGTSEMENMAAWREYIVDTINGAEFVFAPEDVEYGQKSDAVKSWLDEFGADINWESTGHQAVRNSLYVMLDEGRTDVVKAYLELERMGLSSRVWEAVHLTAYHGNYDLLMSIFELVRRDAKLSLGYEMQELVDANIALLNVDKLTAQMQQNIIIVNNKLVDPSSLQDEWLRKPESLRFLTDLYHTFLARHQLLEADDIGQNVFDDSVEGRLLKIVATQDINEIRARLIKDVLGLDEAERSTNSRALSTLENTNLQEMLDTADPAEFPFERHTGLLSRRSIPPLLAGESMVDRQITLSGGNALLTKTEQVVRASGSSSRTFGRGRGPCRRAINVANILVGGMNAFHITKKGSFVGFGFASPVFV